ncbi:MAG TPA: DUF2242 domain-containing protein [Burkholderiaceae bacterium]|jgi:hypothetical protein
MKTIFVLGTLLVLVSACAGPKTTPFQREEFEASDTYARNFAAGGPQACEAARRALLSQGYAVNAATTELVNARKSFQQEADSHVEIEFRVVCTPDTKGADKTLVFASALQERYALKKSNNSASVGVGVIGSLSLPFTGSDDSLVKVASETITAASFYDRYFKLVSNYLGPAVEPPEKP